MDANVVLKNRAAAILLAEMQADPALTAELEAFFAPYCDCNITDWIVSRVNASDSFVIAKIRELIAPVDNFPLIRGSMKPVLGQLLSQYCLGDNFVGVYADGNGGESQKVIENESSRCMEPEQVRFYYPYANQRSLVDAGSDGVIFAPEPYGNGTSGGTVTSQKVYASAPRVPRLQLKIDGLPSGDYNLLTVELFSPYDENGIYQNTPDGKVPINTLSNDWQGGTFSATYDPVSKVIKIQSTYTDTMAGLVMVTVLKGATIVGWVQIYAGRFTYDPVTGENVIYNTFIMNAGSNH